MNQLFNSAAARLTGWYLLIIMFLSIGCSLALYNVSSQDLTTDARRQISYFSNFLSPNDFSEYSNLRRLQLDKDNRNIKEKLVFFNLGVLLVGGAASYALARRTMEPLEESLEAQKRFTSDASHELRTPLAAMQAEIEVSLRTRSLGIKEAKDLLKSNLEEVLKLRSLSDSLLMLAAGNERELVKENVDIKDILSAAVERCQKLASAKKITINISPKSIKINGDEQALTELFVILLDNAVKYSDRGASVDLAVSKKGRAALITVADQGQGIAAAELPRIFERFYRTDASRSKNSADGYGLGLAIAKKITNQHNGTITVKSALKKGSTFSVLLPIN